MFKCDKCGDLDYVLMDGYPFGDRLLEGVMFEVRVDAKGKFSVKIDKDSAAYFSDLNQAKWLKAAKEYAKKNDIWTCPKCSDDVYDIEGVDG